jgi:hypothetical protein
MPELVTKIKDSVDVIHDIGCDYENISNTPTIPDAYTKTETDALLANKVDNDEVYSKSVLNAILDSKADEDNVYSKTAADDLLSAKANAADVYTKSEADTLLSAKADTSAMDSALALKANAADVYTISQTDNLLASKAGIDDSSTTATMTTWSADKLHVDFTGKADASDVYTKAEVDALIGGIKMFPLLDFANPLYTFDQTHLSYTTTEDCWLYGSAPSTGTGTIEVSIDGTSIAIGTSGSGYNDSSSVGLVRIGAGSTVSCSAWSGGTHHTLHLFKEVAS